MQVKYIFVMGGVVSGLGKGITAASLGRLLKARGYKVTMQKLDPYLNVDPGTMNPIQHGEVFVTEDGTETDLDLGHYERFIDENLNRNSNVTSGKVYETVLHREREGVYGGGTVQVIPHITNEITDRFYRPADSSDDQTHIAIIEVGGTVGDIESQPFLEAIRQFQRAQKPEDTMLILVSLVPYLRCSKELKSKPTQAAVRTLQGIGLSPDVIVCRTEVPLSEEVRDKIALFCNVDKTHVLENRDLSCLYEAPLAFEKEHLAEVVCDTLELACPLPKLFDWIAMTDAYLNPESKVRIALVGKYTKLEDAYISVTEALKAGGIASRTAVEVSFIDSETVTADTAERILGGFHGILVPGGFGMRGIDGMIEAARYARTRKIPYLGLCLGMQVACIEFARDACGLPMADSGEFNPDTPDPVIHLMPDQEGITDIGGTLRLGSCPCVLKEGTLCSRLYGKTQITERHRHRYEFNNDYRDVMEEHGMRIAGLSPDGYLVEMIELSGHPFFAATQAHPEFKSRPDRPHPLCKGFIAAAKAYDHQ